MPNILEYQTKLDTCGMYVEDAEKSQEDGSYRMGDAEKIELLEETLIGVNVARAILM